MMHKDSVHEIGMPAIKWPNGNYSWHFKNKYHKVNGISANYIPSNFGLRVLRSYHNLYGHPINLNIGKLVI